MENNNNNIHANDNEINTPAETPAIKFNIDDYPVEETENDDTAVTDEAEVNEESSIRKLVNAAKKAGTYVFGVITGSASPATSEELAEEAERIKNDPDASFMDKVKASGIGQFVRGESFVKMLNLYGLVPYLSNGLVKLIEKAWNKIAKKLNKFSEAHIPSSVNRVLEIIIRIICTGIGSVIAIKTLIAAFTALPVVLGAAINIMAVTSIIIGLKYVIAKAVNIKLD